MFEYLPTAPLHTVHLLYERIIQNNVPNFRKTIGNNNYGTDIGQRLSSEMLNSERRDSESSTDIGRRNIQLGRKLENARQGLLQTHLRVIYGGL